MLTDTDLFSENGLARFHDAVLDGCDKSLTDLQLKTLFSRLPLDTQEMARRSGFSDTVVCDYVCEWAGNNLSEIQAAASA